MPQMANITVKAANGTTDVVYTALAPSAGDKVKAVWRHEDSTKPRGLRPVVSCSSRYSGANKNIRWVDIDFTMPETTVDGLGQISSTRNVRVRLTMTSDDGTADSVINEAVAQATNLLSSALLRDSMKTGYAPT